jgi:hypothetical protein
MRGQFWCIFEFSSSQKVWVMRVYGLQEPEVWVKRGLTVSWSRNCGNIRKK